jgi:hypothetical protein
MNEWGERFGMGDWITQKMGGKMIDGTVDL